MSEVRIQLRRDVAVNWAGANPTLAKGEMGIELDTNKFKFGDGITAWNDLEYGKSDQVVTKLSQLENDCNFTTLNAVADAGYTKNIGTVISINNITPDTAGNVTLDIPTDYVTIEEFNELVREVAYLRHLIESDSGI